MIQTKLTVNRPGDRFEQQADHVADAVMRMPDPASAQKFTGLDANPSLLLRLCAHCEEEKQANSDDDQEFNAKEVPGRTPEVPPAAGQQIGAVRRSGGHNLPPSARGFFEPRFGRDFSDVRIHTGDQAAQSAKQVNALAYTVGRDIVFGAGQYAPDSCGGRRLLAHELTHVVQQTGGGPELVQRTCGRAIGEPTDCMDNHDDPPGDRVLFDVNCDTYRPGAISVVEAFADSMTTSDKVRVHGFASMDGDPDINDNLSCARAVRVAADLEAFGASHDQIERPLLKHGATPGPAAQRRAVVLERKPGASRPVVPQLTAGVMVTNDGGCGNLSRTITWNLSRNSDATNGGFILQEITFVWDVKDCSDTAMAINNLPSPLHYFEAWRVAPGTDTITSCVTTDTWSTNWPNCTSGNVSITGHAVYRDNVAALPGSMFTPNPATLANCLDSSQADPALGGNPSRPVDRQLSFHWGCCPCSSSPTVIDVDR
ncbi:MAG TPA: DUF4157 domain-containing protein [Candidatus Acidoferrales bacterium]|nr:DUF4157 domain-containing protein [Candidatus Acidoferrales bacterium]